MGGRLLRLGIYSSLRGCSPHQASARIRWAVDEFEGQRPHLPDWVVDRCKGDSVRIHRTRQGVLKRWVCILFTPGCYNGRGEWSSSVVAGGGGGLALARPFFSRPPSLRAHPPPRPASVLCW